MTVAVSGDSITFPDNSVQATAPKVGMVNRIINGAMVIDQRNAGASVSATGAYTLDRFVNYRSGGAYTVQRSTTAPAGFINSMLMTNTTAASPTTYSFFSQIIEGFNIADLGFGTATVTNISVSFWVNTSVTGIYSVCICNGGGDRAYPAQYTVNAANTWEYKTITLPSDTTGTWATNNTSGLNLKFNLGSPSGRTAPTGAWVAGNFDGANGSTGATTWANTTGATFYITGVDLRKGSTGAYSNGQNDFDYRDYEVEFAKCQRYAYKNGGTSGEYYASNAGLYFDNNTIIGGVFQFPVTMRATPSLTVYGTPVVKSNAGTTTGFTATLTNASANGSWVQMTKVGHGVASTYLNCINYPTTSDYLLFVSEL